MTKFVDGIEYLIIDLFCGAGGTTTGFSRAVNDKGQRIAKVIACVNHDANAIKSHWVNHPDVLHFTEDIKKLDLRLLLAHVKCMKKLYPNAKVILWASLECTNFSNAKGGAPRDADSRTLADHLHRYVTGINPDYIMIENVVEFMAWGPLDKNGKPKSKDKGKDWIRWRKEICAHGYIDQWKQMNSADYGAYTSRNRLFGVFARPNETITWPVPTHSKKPEASGMFASLQKWKAVKDVLDLQDEGVSIFNRKKPLVNNTLERLYAGMIKWVAGMNQREFISKYYSGSPMDKNISIDGPAGTIKTKDGQALVQMKFLLGYNSTCPRTGERRAASSVELPARTITTQRTPNIVFLSNYYGSGNNCTSGNEPSNTIVARDNHAIAFIDKQFSGPQNHQGIDTPLGAITSVNKNAQVKVQFLINPSWIQGNTTSTDAPCPVIIARQDKAPLYVVALETMDSVAVPIYEDDSPIMIKIKEFMVLYGISDIKMRMLKIPELLEIQGFGKGYKLIGNQKEQKKFIGNSVEPGVPKAWIEAISKKANEVNSNIYQVA